MVWWCINKYNLIKYVMIVHGVIFPIFDIQIIRRIIFVAQIEQLIPLLVAATLPPACGMSDDCTCPFVPKSWLSWNKKYAEWFFHPLSNYVTGDDRGDTRRRGWTTNERHYGRRTFKHGRFSVLKRPYPFSRFN